MTQTLVMNRAMTAQEVMDLPAVVDVETAGRALGIGRTLAYQLARNGQFPCTVVRAGRAFRVVTADLHRVLQVPGASSAAAPAA
ncbi:DNA-binding protein [Streptomyces anulatus]|uniref:DNA-binding protein n=1 Tax=Streptomyces anulatus TaxID=1892 RepID=UPI0036C0B3F7